MNKTIFIAEKEKPHLVYCPRKLDSPSPLFNVKIYATDLEPYGGNPNQLVYLFPDLNFNK